MATIESQTNLYTIQIPVMAALQSYLESLATSGVPLQMINEEKSVIPVYITPGSVLVEYDARHDSEIKYGYRGLPGRPPYTKIIFLDTSPNPLRYKIELVPPLVESGNVVEPLRTFITTVDRYI